MASLQLFLEEGGWVRIHPQADDKEEFEKTVDKLRKIPVISYNKKKKANITSIYYLDSLYKICAKYGFEVYVSENLDEYHERFKLRLKDIEKARNNTEFNSIYWTDDPNFKLEKHQIQAANTGFFAKRWLIGDDMGVGKTPELLAIICKAFENDYDRAIICVLNRLKYQWKTEILKFTKFKEEDISILNDEDEFKCPLNLTDTLDLRSNPCRSCELKNSCQKDRDNPTKKLERQLAKGKIVIVHYEALEKIKKLIVKKKFKFNIFGADEASKLKNHGTQMAKAAKFIGTKLPHNSIIILMSGTFIENVCSDIFSSFRTIDQRILGEWYNFKNNYLVVDYWNKIVGMRNKKRLKEIIDRHITRRSIIEVWLDRPPLHEETRMCEMSSKQKRIYDNAKDGVLKSLSNKESQRKINMADIGPLLNYLLQISDTPETMDSKLKNCSTKIDTLKEIVEHEISKIHKVLIFSFFGNKVIPIIEREIKALDVGKVLTITGKTKEKDAEYKKKLFNENDKYRFLICSDAMSYGQNLQRATYIINVDLPWNPAKLQQRIARCYRKGQTKPVYVYNLATKGTIDESVLEKLGSKKKLFQDMFGKPVKKLDLKELLEILRA